MNQTITKLHNLVETTEPNICEITVIRDGEKTIYDVTLRHLLTMSAPYKYKSEPWTKVCTSDDWTKAALDLLGGRAGITGEFKYATLGIQILAGVIEQATGKSVVDFANEELFLPLGDCESFSVN